MTKVVDLDVMHNLTTLNVTPTSEAQTITPESPVDGYSQVNVAAAPSADLIEKTILIDLPYLYATYNAALDEVDGYSVVKLTGPSQQELDANWYPVTLTADAATRVITVSNTFEADVTAAYQAGKKLYLNVVEEI